jgi:hypothetical protein
MILSHQIELRWLKILLHRHHHIVIQVNQHLVLVMKHSVLFQNVNRKFLLQFHLSQNFSGQKRTTSKQGMVNGSRLVLCCFMLCVLITNPFNYLLNLIHASDSNDATEIQSIVGSRTLQAATNNENMNSSSKIKIFLQRFLYKLSSY